jgi:hypothetical protein
VALPSVSHRRGFVEQAHVWMTNTKKILHTRERVRGPHRGRLTTNPKPYTIHHTYTLNLTHQGEFVGHAAAALQEQAHVRITIDSLVDLTAMAFGSTAGVYLFFNFILFSHTRTLARTHARTHARARVCVCARAYTHGRLRRQQ